ncbi:unnamed protein product [Mytilus coruscus]|uniref:HTH CENPB-type domain-containing protein n=1 Tax=Mytilus coruscus TaxID=42192 RepID=A0A6J8F0Q5_MYTCO|nr:unnamed protein product [Mytilus coruscus]
MPRIGKHIFSQYGPEPMVNVLQAVSSCDIPIKEASVQFGDRESRKYFVDTNTGKKPSDVEKQMVTKVMDLAEQGFGISSRQMLGRAATVCKQLNLKNNFKDGSPDMDWLVGLRRRHPVLSLRKPEKLATVRSRMLNPIKVGRYFVVINIAKMSPTVIWNMDETNLNMEHRPVKVLASAGARSVPGRTGNTRDGRSNIVSGFEATGIVDWNPLAIPVSAFDNPDIGFDESERELLGDKHPLLWVVRKVTSATSEPVVSHTATAVSLVTAVVSQACKSTNDLSTLSTQNILSATVVSPLIPSPLGASTLSSQVIPTYFESPNHTGNDGCLCFQRRTKGIIGTEVSFTDRTPFKSKKEIFLANNENKQNFINLLSGKMVEKGIETKHADADADVLIALTAIESSKTKPTVLLGEDTDLLVLLLYHPDVTSNLLIFKSGNVSKVKTHIKIWDILKTKLVRSYVHCYLYLIHAISGCDTTSRMFGVSKAATLKKLGEHDFVKAQAKLLCNANTKDGVISAGENIISSLYNSASYEGLNVLRYRKFAARVLTNKTCVQIHTLPPTSNAASFHSQGAYFQMKMWMDKDNLNPFQWGWKVANRKLVPVKCTIDAAPSKLLNIIRCNCRTNYDTKRCTCTKNGLECSLACGECKGTGCTNSNKTVDMDD